MALTFTAVKPKRAHPNADLYALAIDAYNEHQELMRNLDGATEQVRILTKRVWAGNDWLRTHDASHPRYERNQQLRHRLMWELRLAEAHVHDLTVARMGRALFMWECVDGLTNIEREALKGAIGVNKVFRPNREHYQRLVENWQSMSAEVEVPH